MGTGIGYYTCIRKGSDTVEEKDFQIGRRIAYGTNGICVIEDIKPMKFTAGMKEKTYFILNPGGSAASKVFVPADNEKLVSKMRMVMTREEIDELLADMRGKKIEWEKDRRFRSESFHEILSRGVTQELLLMIKCISGKKRELAKAGKNLPTTDGNTLKTAERLVEEEFSYTLEIDPSEVGGYIKSRLGTEEES